jgi:hypothetical protein
MRGLVITTLLLLGCTPAGSSTDAGAPGEDYSKDLAWTCLGKVTLDAPSAATVRLATSFVRYDLAGPGAKITTPIEVRGCALTDPTCSTPLSTDLSTTGEVSPSLPTGSSGFDGFLTITGPGNLKTKAYFSPPVVTDTSASANVRGVPSPEALDAIASALGETVNPSRGHLIVRARNCYANNAIHVTFSADKTDSLSTVYYYRGTSPDPSATDTDSTGLGGILNLTPGDVTLTWSVSGKRIGEATLRIEAGAATTVGASPLP